MQLAGGSGRFGGKRSRGVSAMAEINVTPFVDVVLVLLIIFMITAHVMESGIEINVPKTKTVTTSTRDLPIVQITKTGNVLLGRDPLNYNLLAETIQKKYPGQTAVYVRADGETPFDIVAQVLSVLGQAKLGVNIVTQPENTGKSGKR